MLIDMYHIRDMLIAFLNCFVQSALQEALRANVALEDINRTALVRLKQVSIELQMC